MDDSKWNEANLRVLIVMAAAVGLFFLQGALNLTPAYIALVAAAVVTHIVEAVG